MSWGTAEFGGEKCLDHIPGHLRANGSSTHAEDVHVIILDPLLGREVIVNQTSANAFHFVGAHRSADAAAADRHPAIHLTCDDRLGQGHDEVRVIVIRRELVRAEIHNLVSGGTNARD